MWWANTELSWTYLTGSSWCDNELGISYGYIQAEYWGVGLFKYWEPKQIPNFLLAAPMFTLVIAIMINWAVEQFKNFKDLHSNYAHTDYSNISMLLYVCNFQLAGYAHLGLLTVLALCTMHVQVVTRFLVANCPFIFIYCTKFDKSVSRIVLCYFVVYCVVGTVVHSTFYPWTWSFLYVGTSGMQIFLFP